MPIVATNNHPSLIRIAKEGQEVISAERAKQQDIRELHIGFLNMMPDAAFLATERQFFRLIGASNRIVQLHIHPIKIKGIKRSDEITNYINDYYEDFTLIKQSGIDALIITGANPSKKDITQESYWQHAKEIFSWAQDHVTSVFFSCLATHAMLQSRYKIQRTPLTKKLWGIYSHQVIFDNHPLVSNINTRFDMPHSRGNEVDFLEFQKKQLKVLVNSKQAGVAIATSPDGIRQVLCQGHPEYDTLSLLKEYQREINLFNKGIRNDYPPTPENYLNMDAQKIINSWRSSNNQNSDDLINKIAKHIDNTWRDTAKSIFSNWLGIIYQITHVDRKKPFMDNIDPNNPINIK